MKKSLSILLILILSVTLFSCKKNADDTEPYIESVAGKKEETEDIKEKVEDDTEETEDIKEKVEVDAEETDVTKENNNTVDEKNSTFEDDVQQQPESDEPEDARPLENIETEEQTTQYDDEKDHAEDYVFHSSFYEIENTELKTAEEVDGIRFFTSVPHPEHRRCAMLRIINSDSDEDLKDKGRNFYNMLLGLEKTENSIDLSEEELTFNIEIRYIDRTGNYVFYYPYKHAIEYRKNYFEKPGQFYKTTDEFENFIYSLFGYNDTSKTFEEYMCSMA